MRVELIYLKPSGKYYTSDDYEAAAGEWNAIIDEVRGLLDAGRLPGLVDGARYDTLVMLSPPHLLRARPMLTAEECERLRAAIKTARRSLGTLIDYFDAMDGEEDSAQLSADLTSIDEHLRAALKETP